MTDDGTPAVHVPVPPTSTATAVSLVPVGLHGKVSAFDPRQEDWVDYVERLELYFLANDITDEVKKRAILLNAVGPATYRLVKTLAIPGKPTDLGFNDIVEKLKLHFNPKPSPIIKRHEFNKRKQQLNESVSEYVAALRRIAEHCEFGGTLNDMIRDHLVDGIADKRVQDRYFREITLSYKDALSMAQAATKDSRKLRNDGVEDDSPWPPAPAVVTHREETAVHQLTHQKPTRSRTPGRRQPMSPRGSTTAHKECHGCGAKH